MCKKHKQQCKWDFHFVNKDDLPNVGNPLNRNGDFGAGMREAFKGVDSTEEILDLLKTEKEKEIDPDIHYTLFIA